MLRNALFLLMVSVLVTPVAHAKHSVKISFINLPEFKSRVEYVLKQNGYTSKDLSVDGRMAQLMATSKADTNLPSPHFLVDLFFGGFVQDVQPLVKDEQRAALQFRVAENVSREELAQIFSALQAVGGWVEYVRMIPAFNFIVNFKKEARTDILTALSAYDFIDQYHDQIDNEEPTTHYLRDPLRRGTARLTLRLTLKGMSDFVLEKIPPELIKMCVVNKDLNQEFERLDFICPNEFWILQGLVDGVANLARGQSVLVHLSGEYEHFTKKRDESHLLEPVDSKRLVLVPRGDRVFQEAKKAGASEADQLKVGMNLLRQKATHLGYSIFKMRIRHGTKDMMEEFFIELPSEGITVKAMQALLNDFEVYPYLGHGGPDKMTPIVSPKSSDCEKYLLK